MAQEISYPNPLQEITVHRAWESVLRGDTHAASQLRSLIDHSWRRCLNAQVDPNRDKAPHLVPPDTLAQLHEQQHEMVQASAPIMALARDYLSETGSIMILADAGGTILASEGDHRVQDAASGIHLMPGARWSEALCGTNAIGTALEVGEPVQIHSAEHFCAGIKRWTCAATVVRHPTDGDILGAVDVSGLSSTFSRQSLALAVTTAKRIESRLALDELEHRYRLLDASLNRLGAAASSGAVLFDRRGTAIKANAGAQAGILAAGGPADWLRNLRRLSALAQWRQGSPVPLGLPPWLRPEWLQPVMSQGQWLGTLLLLPGQHLAPTPTASAAAPHHVPTPTPNTTASTTPAPAPGHPARPASAADHTDAFATLLHRHPGMQSAVRRARQLASARTAVLLHGETGVGKEAFARGLHGGRRGAFIALNCGGLARDLLASELFGHAEGAFTGARKGGMPGKIEAVQDGTLFLDEIGEMPLDMQPMLLRVLEQGEVCRLGENRLRQVNFRLIAATHRDLREEVAAGRFRMDLYYRIAVTSLRIPPLRERGDDVLLLAQHYLTHFRQQAGLPPAQLPPHVAQRLLAYAWPGNVRELRNAIESAVLLSGSGPLTLESLPPELQDFSSPATASHNNACSHASDPARQSAADGVFHSASHSASACTIRQAQAQAIRAAIDATGGNLTQAARQLGIAKSTLYEKMKRYGLQR